MFIYNPIETTQAKNQSKIIKRPNFYKIVPISIEKQQYTLETPLWLVVNSVPNHRYRLKQKDVLKFGRQQIKIMQIALADISSSALLDTSQTLKTSKKIYRDMSFKQNCESHPKTEQEIANEVISIVSQSQQICRICLQLGQLNNPLICPCRCTGSVRFIHFNCLKGWLGRKLIFSKTKYCVTIDWASLCCEMCKTHYKYRIYLDNKKYYTFQIPRPAKPYIVIQIIRKSAEYSKIIHFVSMSEISKLSMGRKKDIDIKLSQDTSISRHHGNLIYDNEKRQFLIQDNKSKFGTVVLIKRNLIISPRNKGLTIQIGGLIFTLDTHRFGGSVSDYQTQDAYLNVIEKNSEKAAQEEQSYQDSELNDDFGQQLEKNNSFVVQNPTRAILPFLPNRSHVLQNHQADRPMRNLSHHLEISQIYNKSPRRRRDQPSNSLLMAQIQHLDI